MTGTRRTPIARSHTPLITPDLVRRWRRAVALNKHAHRSPAHRNLAYDAEIEVGRMLGTKLWQISVFLDELFVLDRPPDHIVRHGREDDWHHTRNLRAQLRAADQELRRQERAARRARKAAPEPAA